MTVVWGAATLTMSTAASRASSVSTMPLRMSDPSDDSTLPTYGYGLTDLVWRGDDADLSGLQRSLRRARPGVVAFVTVDKDDRASLIVGVTADQVSANNAVDLALRMLQADPEPVAAGTHFDRRTPLPQ